MQDCWDDQNYLNFLQLEKEVGLIDDNSTSLLQLNHENLSRTIIMDLEGCPLNRQAKKIKKRKRVVFHYKKRRNTKLTGINNNNTFTVEEDKKILSLVLEHGPKFGNIMKNFNDRNQNAIKNRYYKYLRFRWDSILGSDYRRLNCKQDSKKVECSDLTQIIDEMTIFPEFKVLLSQLVYRVHSYFN